MSFWPAKRPASAAQHRQANSLPPAHIPTICLQISKYSGEKFSLGKVFTTQHHRDVKLGERLGTRAAVREECWGFPTVTGSVGCPLPPPAVAHPWSAPLPVLVVQPALRSSPLNLNLYPGRRRVWCHQQPHYNPDTIMNCVYGRDPGHHHHTHIMSHVEP